MSDTAKTIETLDNLKCFGISTGCDADPAWIKVQIELQEKNNAALTAAIEAMQAWEAAQKLTDQMSGGLLVQKVYVRDSVASYRVAKPNFLTDGGYKPMDTPQAAVIAAASTTEREP